MKRVVFVAPGVVPPLTEGRKRLVIDLAAALRVRGIEVDVLDGAPSSSSAYTIRRAVRAVANICAGAAPPDVVAVFPFGTFRGLRAWANTWLLNRVRSICRCAEIPVLPIFYSCAGLDLEEIGRRFGPALAVGGEGPSVRMIHLGVDRPLEARQSNNSEMRRILFLCGYQHPGRRAWRDVLYGRGLIDVFRAGDLLAGAGITLTVAIPFFKHPQMRGLLQAEAVRHCPQLMIESQSEVDPIACFAAHDAFVFPYRDEHSVFIPHSLLEALSVGIPTLAADQRMYRELTAAHGVPRCNLHRVGDAGDLATNLLNMQRNYATIIARAAQASIEIRGQWNMEHCVNDVLAAFDQLKK